MKINKTLFAIAIATALTLSAQAQTGVQPSPDVPQTADSDTLTAFGRPIRLGESVVSSFRVSRKVMEMPASMIVSGKFDIQKQSAFTISNVIGNEPGVYMGRDGIWATSVNVRGLGEDRLVSLIDGNRIETATDLTASLSMIDVNDIERVEIIKGAQSSLYGTGAMGGIINVITKDGHFADKTYVDGNLISGYATANKYLSNNLSVNVGGKKLYLRVSGTYGKADDMRTPQGILENSQFNTSNISAKAGYQPAKNHLIKVQFQRNNSWDVGIPGGSTFPTKAEARYTDIKRTLVDASYQISNLTDNFKSLKLSYFHQAIDRNVLMYPHSVTETKLPNGNIQRQMPDSIAPLASHITNGVQLQGTFEFADNNTLIVGTDLWRRDISADRTKYVTMQVIKPDGVVAATNKIIRRETSLPTAYSANAGIYAQDEANFMDGRLKLLTGIRIDANMIKNDTVYNVDYTIVNGVLNNNPAGKAITFDAGKFNTLSWSANVGMLYKVAKDVDLTANIARSFRAPSLEERFKYIDLGAMLRLGNPELKPESGYSGEIGVRVWRPRFNLEASAYVNRIENMIVEAHGESIGSVATMVNQNIGKALLYGFELKTEYNVVDNLVAFLSGSYVRGINIEDSSNLPSIPPMNGRLGLRYTYPTVGSVDFTVVGATAQNKIASGEVATDGYLRYDMSLCTRRFDFAKVLSIQLFAGIDNITDVAYANHLSTNRGDISVEPGRNIFFRINFGF